MRGHETLKKKYSTLIVIGYVVKWCFGHKVLLTTINSLTEYQVRFDDT